MLLKHALDATVSQVEERCRQIRNVSPGSAQHAQRAWERRSIPRNGHRLEDFVDDDVGGDPDDAVSNPSREGFCTTPVQREWERAEVREIAPFYRLRRSRSNGEGRIAAAPG